MPHLDEGLPEQSPQPTGFLPDFCRIHRNALVARRAILGLEKDTDGNTLVQLRGCDERLSVSRRHPPELRRRLRSGIDA